MQAVYTTTGEQLFTKYFPHFNYNDVHNYTLGNRKMHYNYMDNIFNQASFKKNVWVRASVVMDLYEEGNTKDQSLTAKQLITKPEFRQQYLSCIQCLPDPFKMKDVLDGDLSLSELKDKDSEYRSIKEVQKAFCR